MKKLAKSEWCFHEIEQGEEHAAWIWEIEREAGSGKAPWLRLQKSEREAILKTLRHDRCLQEIPTERLNPEYIATHEDAHLSTPIQLHAFQINWSAGRGALVKSFETWLRNTEHEKSRVWSEWQNHGGRKGQWKSLLVDLVIYRAVARNYKCWQAENEFKPLKPWSKIGSSVANKFSANHWREAARKTAERIKEAEAHKAAWL